MAATLDPTGQLIAARVISDLAVGRWVGGDDAAFRIMILQRLYSATPPEFYEDALHDMVRDAHDNQVEDEFLEEVQFRVESYPEELQIAAERNLAYAAQDDDDSLDGRTETPAEETPEV